MQVPMEILSQMMTRADSGMSVRQGPSQGFPQGSPFERILAEAFAGSQPFITDKKPNAANAEDEPACIEPIMPEDEDEDNADEALAAGAMGNQTEVIFILEGDKESATTPPACVESTAEIGPSRADCPPAADEEKPGPATAKPDVPELKEPGPADAKNAEIATTTDKAQYAAKDAGAANTETMAKPDTGNVESNTGAAAGEVTARTPIIRTSERQERGENSPNYSNKGDLSPLENENDAPVREQREKTFTETVAPVRDAAEGAQEQAPHAPLAEGIRPEQFRAYQQMKQVPLNAPVKAENLFEEMVSRIQTMKTDSQSTMTIQLKPEFLGKVALEIAIDAAGLHVRIDAADGGVRGMINGQINALIESLENKGIAVSEVEVTHTGVDNGAFKESREGQHAHKDRSRRSYRDVGAADSVAFYTAMPIETLDYYLDSGVSSVQYSA